MTAQAIQLLRDIFRKEGLLALLAVALWWEVHGLRLAQAEQAVALATLVEQNREVAALIRSR